MITDEQKQQLWDLIKQIKVGMVVSHHNEDLRARPMHIVQDEFDGILYFFTKKSSAKVAEINDDHDICIAFADPEEDSYVSCTGFANVIRDQDLIDQFWNPFVAAWFPEGKKSKNVALLEVKITEAELWDSDQSDMVQLFEIAKANLKGETPDMGENKKFG